MRAPVALPCGRDRTFVSRACGVLIDCRWHSNQLWISAVGKYSVRRSPSTTSAKITKMGMFQDFGHASLWNLRILEQTRGLAFLACHMSRLPRSKARILHSSSRPSWPGGHVLPRQGAVPIRRGLHLQKMDGTTNELDVLLCASLLGWSFA